MGKKRNIYLTIDERVLARFIQIYNAKLNKPSQTALWEGLFSLTLSLIYNKSKIGGGSKNERILYFLFINRSMYF